MQKGPDFGRFPRVSQCPLCPPPHYDAPVLNPGLGGSLIAVVNEHAGRHAGNERTLLHCDAMVIDTSGV